MDPSFEIVYSVNAIYVFVRACLRVFACVRACACVPQALKMDPSNPEALELFAQVRARVYARACVRTCACVRVRACVRMCASVHPCICMCACVRACVHVCALMCACSCICVSGMHTGTIYRGFPRSIPLSSLSRSIHTYIPSARCSPLLLSLRPFPSCRSSCSKLRMG
jgi:hypothetical protein